MGDPCQDHKKPSDKSEGGSGWLSGGGSGGGGWLGGGGGGGSGGGGGGGSAGGGGWLGGGSSGGGVGGGSAGGGGWLGGGSSGKGGAGGSTSAGGKKGSKGGGEGAPAAPKPSNPIMAPPTYGDLGKKARDVFGSGYHFGLIKLDLKTKSDAGVEFTSGLTSNQESGKVFGSLQSKYKVKDYGLTFTEKWNTDNTLATDVTVQDQLVEGLKLTLDASFAPQTGSKSGKLKTAYANETVSVNCDMDLDLAGPVVDTAAVLKYQGWLAGYQTQFDTQKTKLTKNNFALGFTTGDFVLHTNVDNGKDFGGSIFQKVSEKLECGISMNWSSGSADTRFGVGAKYALDSDASLRAKVNNASQIGLGYQQKLRDGITLTLSALIDGQNFNAGGHKIGLALELEP